ncbi:hypothetical protein EVAR_46989_1 [Eumeta japonica]|uniref:Uncharacterized protein n=1 Tax=Eumeta variegata TaxID=151549 RepID=A0A4C1X5A3_EUMVA|nr:hypothetical protein EVAR_46989_1 [Eumeta japonica]
MTGTSAYTFAFYCSPYAVAFVRPKLKSTCAERARGAARSSAGRASLAPRGRSEPSGLFPPAHFFYAADATSSAIATDSLANFTALGARAAVIKREASDCGMQRAPAVSKRPQQSTRSYVYTGQQNADDSDCFRQAIPAHIRFVPELCRAEQTYAPTGFEKYGHTCAVADHTVNYSVWDTSGLLRLPQNHGAHHAGANATS